MRAWKWWDSSDWRAYTNATTQGNGRPVHGPSHVIDLGTDLWKGLSKGHRSAMKTQMDINVHTSKNVDAYHRVHAAHAGRETRSQASWDLMQDWVNHYQGVCLTNGTAWSYVIIDPPGAYYASSAGRPAHWLQMKMALGLQAAGFEWYELGEGHTPGINTFKKGFGGVLIDP